jgi:hypothetical protein
MKCKEFQYLIILYIQNEINQEDKIRLENHLKTCLHCRKALKQERDLVHFIDKERNHIPEPDWKRSWQVISSKTGVEDEKKVIHLPRFRRWMPHAAAILLVFFIGIFVGRSIFLVPPEPDVIPTSSPAQRYIEGIKPFLIGFMRQAENRRTEDISALEKEVIRDMLFQTRLLKQSNAQEDDPYFQELLEELELILIEISNHRSGDRNSVTLTKKMIRKKGIKLKLLTLNTLEKI